MTKTILSCNKCNDTNQANLLIVYVYTICNNCKSKLGLFQDTTIARHIKSFAIAKNNDVSQPTFKQDVLDKLTVLEQIYISKKIKLLHIQGRIEQLG